MTLDLEVNEVEVKVLTSLASIDEERAAQIYELVGGRMIHLKSIADDMLESNGTLEGMCTACYAENRMVEGNWKYAGRTKFKKLVEELKKVRESDNLSTVLLYGTQGYGKSHLLAALVCYLTGQDERVVYIPDCRVLLEDPVEYFRAAMLFAWADDITAQKKIETLDTWEGIRKFFKSQKNITFVIDQKNGLEGLEEMTRIEKWLKRCTYGHKRVYSSSANHREIHALSVIQNSNSILHVHGGLDEAEMKQWWKRHSGIDMGGYEKYDVEDVTGKIPLLLDKCVVGWKIDLTVADLREIYHKAVGFVQEIRARTKEHGFEWDWYVKYVTACFCRKKIPSGWPAHLHLIDHRYFYQLDDDSGNYTCGLIRDAVGEQLLELNIRFADTIFLDSLSEFIDNPSVTGFMIQHAVLPHIRSYGSAISAEIGASMIVRLLTEPSDIKTDIMNQPVLYRPQKFNFRAIDGIVVLIKSGERNNANRPKLLMFPFQITMAPDTHSDSHAIFFKEYKKWTKHLSDFDVEPQFLWISPEYHYIEEHKRRSKIPEHNERYIPLEEVDAVTWQKYKHAKRVADEARAGLAG